MATVPKTDLVWIYRALRIFRDVIQESPELLNRDEHETFLIAWNAINNYQVEKYIEDFDI
jgi:hypothetical protein